MSLATQHHMAKRGSPRFAAQCSLLKRMLTNLNINEDPMARQYAMQDLALLRANFFYFKKIQFSICSRKILDHLLLASSGYVAENRYPMELDNMAKQLRWFHARLPSHSRMLRRLRKKLSEEADRLDAAYLVARRYELSWQKEFEWEALKSEQNLVELARSVRKALSEMSNPNVRLNANRWVAQYREFLPIAELDCENLFIELRRVPVLERPPIERFWAAIAIIATLTTQEILPRTPLWEQGRERVELLTDGDEMTTEFDTVAARSYFRLD